MVVPIAPPPLLLLLVVATGWIRVLPPPHGRVKPGCRERSGQGLLLEGVGGVSALVVVEVEEVVAPPLQPTLLLLPPTILEWRPRHPPPSYRSQKRH